jgi:hypothetical protein
LYNKYVNKKLISQWMGIGILGYWDAGMLGYWDTGILGYWEN